jgi:hypothetical protein
MHRVALGLVLLLVACGGSARSDGQQAPSSDAGGGATGGRGSNEAGGQANGDAGEQANGDAGEQANGDAGEQANGDAGEPSRSATDGGGAGGAPGSAGAAGQRSECSALDCLAGAHFTYQPTRTWHAPVGSVVPTSELSETDYTPLLGEPIALTFSDDASAVELIPSAGGTTVHGSRNPTRTDRAWYDLDLFAGGRFVVSLAEGQFLAEYTIYGSGRPIVSSTRGTLSPSPRSSGDGPR